MAVLAVLIKLMTKLHLLLEQAVFTLSALNESRKSCLLNLTCSTCMSTLQIKVWDIHDKNNKMLLHEAHYFDK